jgi:hypothetical protein
MTFFSLLLQYINESAYYMENKSTCHRRRHVIGTSENAFTIMYRKGNTQQSLFFFISDMFAFLANSAALKSLHSKQTDGITCHSLYACGCPEAIVSPLYIHLQSSSLNAERILFKPFMQIITTISLKIDLQLLMDSYTNRLPRKISRPPPLSSSFCVESARKQPIRSTTSTSRSSPPPPPPPPPSPKSSSYHPPLTVIDLQPTSVRPNTVQFPTPPCEETEETILVLCNRICNRIYTVWRRRWCMYF